ncbi:MAG TPA: 3-hydroxyacyl-[acyl-carrier-protein] dehydratase FabZ [Elusimicrobia bacterium]|nr:3-hydroxyacyl-[acyl-carrier-protein] dehydratase FabZ [Elusimicrobiota bacterium]HCE97822.1 3-hydroxyacyl-[acyl-carrier-protein] dehydratase FabZ [Elusimicrobiota bacterium]
MNETTPPVYKPVRIISCEEILKIIPHRYPFLLVDRVEIIEETKRCVGVKCVSGNELYFHGHFPEKPIMPGVLIIEGMAQTAAAMMMSLPEIKGHFVLFAGIRAAKFRRQVVPGDVLKYDVEMLRFKGKMGKVSGRAFVENALAAEAELTFAVD